MDVIKRKIDRKVDTSPSDFLVLLDWMTKSRTVLKLRWAVSVEHIRVARAIPDPIHKRLNRLGKIDHRLGSQERRHDEEHVIVVDEPVLLDNCRAVQCVSIGPYGRPPRGPVAPCDGRFENKYPGPLMNRKRKLRPAPRPVLCRRFLFNGTSYIFTTGW